MADSANVDVPVGAWTEVLDVDLTALICNDGSHDIKLREKAGGAPAITETNGILLRRGEKITMTTPLLGRVYAWAINQPAVVVVTIAP